MTKIDIVCSVFGNLRIVKECMDTWFPIPENYTLYVYNNKVSDIDGTTEYLKNKQKEFNFVLLDERKNNSHDASIEALLPMTTSPWILMLDSDVKLLNRNVFNIISNDIVTQHFKVWGRVHFNRPKFNNNRHHRTKFTLTIPRTFSWFLLFNKNFIVEEDLSLAPASWPINSSHTFDSIDCKFIEGKATTFPLWVATGVTEEQQILQPIPVSFNIFGDTSWQYYWAATEKNVFGILPDSIWDSCQHKHASSHKMRKFAEI